MSTAHSQIGASSMYRWENCPGSVRLSKGLTQIESPYAKEGTKAHEIGEHYLRTSTWPKFADPEMVEAVSVYTDFVEDLWTKASGHPDSFILVEHKFDLSKLYPGLFGTADCVIFDGHIKTLYVIDYKHGQGIPVKVKGNSQLRYYALGALISTSARARKVVMVVAQPRCFHEEGPIRSEEISAIDLVDFADRLVEAAKRTEDPKAPLNPGEHCRFCPASGLCPALHGKALTLAKEEFTPTLSYNPEKLSEALSQLETIEAWIKGVRDFAYNEAIHGRTPPGWKLVDKRATRKWAEVENLEMSLMNEFSLDQEDIFERKLKSPAGIEKVIGKSKEMKQKLEKFTISVSSGTVLVPESDPRPPALSAPQDEFTIVNKTN